MPSPAPLRHSVPDDDLVRLRDMIDRTGFLPLLDAIRFEIGHEAARVASLAADPNIDQDLRRSRRLQVARLQRLDASLREGLRIFGVES
jgi:hypothetical protein